MRLIPSQARQALRRLSATPLLSVAAILTLAIGIGSAVVMVDVLDRLLLRAPAHVTDPDRVARIYVRIGDSYVDRTGHATFEALGSMRDELEASAAYFTESLSLGRGSGARRLEAVPHSGGYFDVLGLRPAIGSWAKTSNAAGEDAAVISHALWQQEFGGAPDVLGKPLRLGLDTYNIVAVAPRGFRGIGWTPVDVWLPLVPRARATYGEEWKSAAMFLQGLARLRPGVSRERASEIATAGFRANAQPWEKKSVVVLGDLRAARAPGAPLGTRVEVLVAGMSIVVLIITCGNVANLLLVRGLRRDREFVVKTALGASRARLVREVLLEAALLAAGAGVVSLVVVMTGDTLMRRLFLSPITALAAPLDGRLVLVTVVFCVAAAFLLGLAPAFRLTTRRALSPGQSAVVRPSRLLDLFSGLQVALSLPMIVAAALFVLSLWNARNQDLGMQTGGVAVVTTNLFEVGRPMENHAAHRQMQARLAALPLVESTAVIQNMPMRSSVTFLIDVPGRPAPTGPVSSDGMPLHNPVDPSFFTVMRMRLAVVGAYGVTRRTREIGIRWALGAGPQHLVRLVLARSLFVVVTGLAAGIGLAWAGGRILNAQLFDVTAGDPRVLGTAAFAVLVIGCVAAWLPARRAARIEPVIALRTE